MSVTITGVGHRFDDVNVLKAIDLEIEEGEIVCILGPSGSGKSTLLRLIAGLEVLQQGSIELNGKTMATASLNLPPEHRSVGMVFQDHVLFPHLNVAANVAFGLGELNQVQRETRVTELLHKIGMDDFTERYPHTLSGGQAQRIALARALAPMPAVLLLDEPFASVDSPLRRALRESTRAILKSESVSALMVTHDPDEAMAMADRIVCLVDGVIVQSGFPETLWRSPAHPFVAQTLVGGQLIVGSLKDNKVVTAFGSFNIQPSEGALGDCLVAVFEGGVSLTTERAEDAPKVRVADIRFSSGAYLVMVEAEEQRLEIKTLTAPELSVGDQVSLNLNQEHVAVYPSHHTNI